MIKLMRKSRSTLKRHFREIIVKAKQVMLRLDIVPRPFRVQIDITDMCNFRCPTCSKWRGDSKSELETHEWKTVFEKIGKMPILREVSISGGEPFMRSDIFEILKFVKRQDLYVVLISNGWFINETTLSRLGGIGLDRLMISLNSLRESVHDSSRGTPGSFKRIMRLVELWRSQPKNTDLCIETVIMESNCSELSDLANFTAVKGLNGIIYQVLASEKAHYPFAKESHMPESSFQWYSEDPLWVRSAENLRREIEKLLQKQDEGLSILNPSGQLKTIPLYYENPEAIRNRLCLGTLSTLYIDPFGDMRLCYGYPPIGNIIRNDPTAVWRSEQARKIRRESRSCQRLCRLLNNNL